jgi:predicted nucleic acid-binding protein
VVIEELREGSIAYPELVPTLELDWVHVARLATIDEIRCFAEWVRRIGRGDRDCGEASVLAAAESRASVALTDDREATRVGRAYGAKVHGSIWLLAGACRAGKLTEVAAGNLIRSTPRLTFSRPATGGIAGSSTYPRNGSSPIPARAATVTRRC